MNADARPIRVLLDMMRAADDGQAGIPQETRLLFRGLSLIGDVHIEGLMQSAERVLAAGLPPPGSAALARLPADEQLDRLGRIVISLEEGNWSSHPQAVLYTIAMAGWHLCGGRQTLSYFSNGWQFRDYLWRRFFALTLPATDFELVTRGGFRVARMPWNAMNLCALATQAVGLPGLFVRLDTSDFDVMIAQTPYPATASPSTRLIVRYHDAIPMTMPQTIGQRRWHQRFHYQALRHSVASGAWFACVSEATRNQLLEIFPQAAPHSATIHNMVSHDYFDEASTPERVPEIAGTRLIKTVQRLLGQSMNRRRLDENPEATPPDYLLIVSRIDPRKNHLLLLSAWERLRSGRFPALQIIGVGLLGSHYEPIVRKFLPWVEQGVAHLLEDVPTADLRLLYKHARATICPSIA